MFRAPLVLITLLWFSLDLRSGAVLWNARHDALQNLLSLVNVPGFLVTVCLPLLARTTTPALAIAPVLLNLTYPRLRYQTINHTPTNTGLENPLAAIHPTMLVFTVTLTIILAVHTMDRGIYSPKLGNTVLLWRVPGIWLLVITALLSAWWANQELFWGYYWNWDPVEMTLLIYLFLVGVVTHQVLKPHTTYVVCRARSLYILGTITLYLLNKGPAAQSVHSFSNSFFLTIGSVSGTATTVCALALLVISTNLLVSQVAKNHTRYEKALKWASVVAATLIISVVAYALATLVGLLLESQSTWLSKTTASKAFLHASTLVALLHTPTRKRKAFLSAPTSPTNHIVCATLVLSLTLPWFKDRPCLYTTTLGSANHFSNYHFFCATNSRMLVYRTSVKESVYLPSKYFGFLKPRHSIYQPSAGTGNKFIQHIFYKFNTTNCFVTLSDRVIKPIF